MPAVSFMLRVWDRDFLLGSLTSLLQQIPCESVRLVAFNLDQTREVFRQDHFDKAGFQSLAQTLQDFELEGIPTQTPQQPKGWADFLMELGKREAAAQDASDIVIFLGPATYMQNSAPSETFKPLGKRCPQFFYFEYFPLWESRAEYTDSIEPFIKVCGGSVFKLQSPYDFAQDIYKMLIKLKQAEKKPVSGG
jgi:hypothetical protein